MDAHAPAAGAFAARVFEAVLGAMDAWSIYLGEKLGYYAALAERGPLTPADLAAAAGTDRRYAREWLEQQAVTGILEAEDHALAAEERRYALPAGHAEVLTDGDSLSHLAPLVRLATAAGVKLPATVEAYRTGGGVPWADFGPDMRTGQADMNRPWFLHALGKEWFPAAPDLHARLLAGGRVADVGCGEGWSSIGIARAYPGVSVDGFDLDGPSIEAAREHARDAGLEHRVRFHDADAGALGKEAAYDVVTAFECIHDMPRPVEVLSAMRRVAAPDGHVVVMDERVADAFPGRGDDVERLMYGFSILICLPDGMSNPPSAATGAVMRADALRGYAREAGFSDAEVLPIENDFWRFYRLLR